MRHNLQHSKRHYLRKSAFRDHPAGLRLPLQKANWVMAKTVDPTEKRLKILSEAEIEDLFGRPHFIPEELPAPIDVEALIQSVANLTIRQYAAE